MSSSSYSRFQNVLQSEPQDLVVDEVALEDHLVLEMGLEKAQVVALSEILMSQGSREEEIEMDILLDSGSSEEVKKVAIANIKLRSFFGGRNQVLELVTPPIFTEPNSARARALHTALRARLPAAFFKAAESGVLVVIDCRWLLDSFADHKDKLVWKAESKTLKLEKIELEGSEKDVSRTDWYAAMRRMIQAYYPYVSEAHRPLWLLPMLKLVEDMFQEDPSTGTWRKDLKTWIQLLPELASQVQMLPAQPDETVKPIGMQSLFETQRRIMQQEDSPTKIVLKRPMVSAIETRALKRPRNSSSPVDDISSPFSYPPPSPYNMSGPNYGIWPPTPPPFQPPNYPSYNQYPLQSSSHPASPLAQRVQRAAMTAPTPGGSLQRTFPAKRCFRCNRVGHYATTCQAHDAPSLPNGIRDAAVSTAVFFVAKVTQLRNVSFFGFDTAFWAPKPNTSLDHPFAIVTPFKIDEWRRLLIQTGLLGVHGHLLAPMQHGFPMACNWQLTYSIIPNNHSSATSWPKQVEAYIQEEEDAGRYSCPFSRADLESQIGFFYCAPLGTVEKDGNPEKRRIIHDNTFPRGSPHSLNAHLTSQNDLISWTTFADIVQMVATAPDGARGGGFDGKAAYRQCATRVQDQHYTVVQWDGKFRVDRCKQFGEKNGGVPHGQVAGMLVDVIKAIFPSLDGGKWADDFVFIQRPKSNIGDSFEYECELKEVVGVANDVGYMVNSAKIQPFSDSFQYLGFIFDLKKKAVFVSDKKRQKYLQRLDGLLSRKPLQWTLEEVESVAGCLSHIRPVVLGGRAHLQSLWRAIGEIAGSDLPEGTRDRLDTERIHYAPGQAVCDLVWWRSKLRQPKVGVTLNREPPSNMWSVFTDASKWGIGVVINGKWNHWRLKEGWDSPETARDIGWAEAVAVEFAVRVLLHHYSVRDTHIQIQCDNRGVVDGWARGASRSSLQNEIFLFILESLLTSNCWLTLSDDDINDPWLIPFLGPRVMSRSDIYGPAPKTYIRFRDTRPLSRGTQMPVSAHLRQKQSATTLNIVATPKQPDPRFTTQMQETEQKAINASWAKSTKANYDRLLGRFLTWARQRGFKEHEILPANEDLICFYIAEFAGVYGDSHAKACMYAIRAWHIQNRFPWYQSQRLDAIISGIRKPRPENSTRAKRPPVSLEMLRILRRDLKLDKPVDACYWAGACSAFWASIRLGELWAPTIKDFEPATKPRVSHIKVESEDCLILHLPYTKTTQNRGDDAYIFRQEADLDPITAIQNHVRISYLQDADTLFAYRKNPRAKLTVVSKDQFMKRCNAAWQKAGLAKVSGHSFRIGGATVYLEYGLESDKVKKLGRWKSDAALLYWRNLARVLGQDAIRVTKRKKNPLAVRQASASGGNTQLTIRLPPRHPRSQQSVQGGH